jgi:hypothetical protein
MSTVECGRGHLYDASVYSSCPYCNSAQQPIRFGGTPVDQGGKTMPLAGGGNPDFGTMNAEGLQTMSPMGYSGFQPDVSVIADGKTAPPKGYGTPKSVVDENKTVGMMREKHGVEPVVGWLVCVEGKQKGKSFELKGRINTIGRSDKMDISIRDDKTISNENHARLGYGEKNNRFTLIPAENKNVIYLNNEDVYIPTPLAAYDIIDFGETKLIFIPLCCDKFNWNSDIGGDDKNASV